MNILVFINSEERKKEFQQKIATIGIFGLFLYIFQPEMLKKSVSLSLFLFLPSAAAVCREKNIFQLHNGTKWQRG